MIKHKKETWFETSPLIGYHQTALNFNFNVAMMNKWSFVYKHLTIVDDNLNRIKRIVWITLIFTWMISWQKQQYNGKNKVNIW